MAELGMNIDHVATLRQARRTYEPDPVWAAVQAQLAGASIITMHLREDRRHIQDHDVRRVQATCQVKLNLEMAATDEMVKIACDIKPGMATLVPEGRMEVTTEGGLDVAGQLQRMREVVSALSEAGIACSAFIDAEPLQVEAAAEAGFAMCELHTGPYAQQFHEAQGDVNHPAVAAQLKRLRLAGREIASAGLRFNAGHALNYQNVKAIVTLISPAVSELHIGHSIVSRAVFVGLPQAVREMVALIQA
jgi:pyridoxine 5-phosphate synthase